MNVLGWFGVKRSNQKEEEMSKVQMKVTGIHASSEGAYIEIHLPISFDAFHVLERELEAEGLIVYSRGGSGDDRECQFKFGPFTEYKDAEELIKRFQEKVKLIYSNEDKYCKQFEGLKGEYSVLE